LIAEINKILHLKNDISILKNDNEVNNELYKVKESSLLVEIDS